MTWLIRLVYETLMAGEESWNEDGRGGRVSLSAPFTSAKAGVTVPPMRRALQMQPLPARWEGPDDLCTCHVQPRRSPRLSLHLNLPTFHTLTRQGLDFAFRIPRYRLHAQDLACFFANSKPAASSTLGSWPPSLRSNTLSSSSWPDC